MKNFKYTAVLFLTLVSATISSCSSTNRTMREPNARVELTKNDFDLSEQVMATVTVTKYINIDWSRLRGGKTGTVVKDANGAALPIDPIAILASVPVIGGLAFDRTASYALHDLMEKNPGYDVVFYPQFETTVSKPIIGIGFFKRVITVVVKARLGKLKK